MKGMAKNGKTQDWDSFREQWNEIFKDLKSDLNEWVVSRGAPKLPEGLFHPQSPYLNIYTHPKELDYKIFEALPKNWVRFDCLKKPMKNIEKFAIPENLMSKPGKLIYLSMGDFAELELMKRLTTSLSKSQNKFIVSKGPSHDKYELPDNMWGIEKLPEKSVIPLVDLVITVGDNETIFDAFYYSKPLLVLPLIGEQLDNGQRVRENGFGLDLNPYTYNDMALFGSIYGTLDDLLLRRRMTAISHRMRTSGSIKQASNMIENILNQNSNILH
jgi:UDP:flavonoid glycosyltransferase YjiC (YdhE family)